MRTCGSVLGRSTRRGSPIGEIARDGARQMLAAALPAEVAAYLDAHAGQVDMNGCRLCYATPDRRLIARWRGQI